MGSTSNGIQMKGELVRSGRGRLSREQFAVRAGVHSRTIGRVENEEGPVHRGTATLIAHALGLELADLVREPEELAA